MQDGPSCNELWILQTTTIALRPMRGKKGGKSMVFTKRSLLAAHLLILASTGSAFAKEKAGKESLDHTQPCLEVPKGISLRGYGKNIATDPRAYLKCLAFNDQGCLEGFVESLSGSIDPVTAADHRFVVKDGCLEVTFKVNTDLLYQVPVDCAAIAAFPEVAPYVCVPDAQLWIFSGNHSKCDLGTLAWKGQGSLKHANYVEVRCVFLVLPGENQTPRVEKCLGCHWFIGRK